MIKEAERKLAISHMVWWCGNDLLFIVTFLTFQTCATVQESFWVEWTTRNLHWKSRRYEIWSFDRIENKNKKKKNLVTVSPLLETKLVLLSCVGWAQWRSQRSAPSRDAPPESCVLELWRHLQWICREDGRRRSAASLSSKVSLPEVCRPPWRYACQNSRSHCGPDDGLTSPCTNLEVLSGSFATSVCEGKMKDKYASSA